jgi:hypothetical protein
MQTATDLFGLNGTYENTQMLICGVLSMKSDHHPSAIGRKTLRKSDPMSRKLDTTRRPGRKVLSMADPRKESIEHGRLLHGVDIPSFGNLNLEEIDIAL